jgi:hypothetical protein
MPQSTGIMVGTSQMNLAQCSLKKSKQACNPGMVRSFVEVAAGGCLALPVRPGTL